MISTEGKDQPVEGISNPPWPPCFPACFFTVVVEQPLNTPSISLSILTHTSHQNLDSLLEWTSTHSPTTMFSSSSDPHHDGRGNMFSSNPNPHHDARGESSRRRHSLPVSSVGSPVVLTGTGATRPIPIPAGFPPANRRPLTSRSGSDRSPSATTFETNPYAPQPQYNPPTYEDQRAQTDALAARVTMLKDMLTALRTENKRLKDDKHALERLTASSDKLLAALTGYPLSDTTSRLSLYLHQTSPPTDHPPALSLW